MSLARPLDRFPLVRTHSVEEVREAFSRVYAKPTLEPGGRVGMLDVIFNNYQLPHIGLSYIKYGAAVRLSFPTTNYFSQLFSIGGKGEFVIGRTALPIMPGRGLVI